MDRISRRVPRTLRSRIRIRFEISVETRLAASSAAETGRARLDGNIRWRGGASAPHGHICTKHRLPASEPTWHCLNSRKAVIVILLSGFLSTTDSKEWRGNQVPPRYRKSCIRLPAFLIMRFPSGNLSTTRGLSIWKRSRNPHFCADRSAYPSGADPFPKRPLPD